MHIDRKLDCVLKFELFDVDCCGHIGNDVPWRRTGEAKRNPQRNQIHVMQLREQQ